MYYGHSSWIVLVVFGGMFAMRYVSTQRRRGGFRGGRASRSSFTGPQRRGPTGGATDCDRTGGTASTGTAAGWFRDPFFKHNERYWSGTEWTEHVADGGVPGTDPPASRDQLGD
jgi:hypothetical protein